MKPFLSECPPPATAESRVIFRFEEIEVPVAQVIHSACFRGELVEAWQTVLRRLGLETRANAIGLSADVETVQSFSEAFRYEHDLISAEETEVWLGSRDISREQFSRFFLQQYWMEARPPELEGLILDVSLDPTNASADQREWLRVTLMLTNEITRLAREFGWRLAARAAMTEPSDQAITGKWDEFRARASVARGKESNWAKRLGETDGWLEEQIRLEACFESICQSVVSSASLDRAVSGRGVHWLRFEVETLNLPLREAAEEARLCVELDGTPMDEVARRCRVSRERMTVFLEELPEDLQEMLMRTGEGKCLDIIETEDGYQLNRVVAKVDPKICDDVIRERARDWVLHRHFADLCGHRIHWSMDESTDG